MTTTTVMMVTMVMMMNADETVIMRAGLQSGQYESFFEIRGRVTPGIISVVTESLFSLFFLLSQSGLRSCCPTINLLKNSTWLFKQI